MVVLAIFLFVLPLIELLYVYMCMCIRIVLYVCMFVCLFVGLCVCVSVPVYAYKLLFFVSWFVSELVT